jgi:hypothetical protein
VLRDLGDPRKIRASAGNHETACQHVETSRLLELTLDQAKHFRDPRLDNLSENEFREDSRRSTAGRWNFQGIILSNPCGDRGAVLTLNFLSGRKWGAKTSRDIVRNMITTNGENRGELHRAPVKYRDTARAAADIEQAHPKLLLLF